MPAKYAFSELLKQHRHAAGCSQEALAERSGLSVRSISALEQGSRRGPYRDTVAALCEALGLSEDERAELEEAAASARGRSGKEASTLPAPFTSFIERPEVSEIVEGLNDLRLLTITGTGGVGKTRVAIEVARRSEESFDKMWFIDLLPVRDPGMVAPHIATQTSVSVTGGDVLAAIARQLGSHHALLVLDNCEHVIDETATILGNLLRDCPQLTVLVTSREALGLVAESVFRLQPMNAAAAIQLFVARAKAQDRGMSFDSERLAIVADICKELDQLPLAIELAASRLSSLGFDELRKRLKSSATLASNRALSGHYQTVVDTIQWSYDLLTEVDRLVFDRLSVFIGGFTLASAEDVCADETVSAVAVAESVLRLVQKSLIDADLIGTSTRYRFLETIRSFAWSRLSQKGDVAGMMSRLIDWLNREALRVGPTPSPESTASLRWELDNLTASVSWAIGAEDTQAAVTASHALRRFANAAWGTHRQAEMRQLIFGLLDRLRDDENPEAVGLLISGSPNFVTAKEVSQLTARAVPLLISTGWSQAAAAVHARAAHCEIYLGNAQAAEAHLIAAAPLLTLEERTQSSWGFSYSMNYARVRCFLGDFAAARAALEDLVVVPGSTRAIESSITLADIAFQEQNFQQAFRILEEPKRALGAYAPGHPFRLMVIGNAAKYALLAGDVSAAEIDLRQALVDSLFTSLEPDTILWAIVAYLARYAAVFAAKAGRLELAARIFSSTETSLLDPSALSYDRHPTDLAAPFLAGLSAERAEELRALGTSEDVYDLIEEFLAD